MAKKTTDAPAAPATPSWADVEAQLQVASEKAAAIANGASKQTKQYCNTVCTGLAGVGKTIREALASLENEKKLAAERDEMLVKRKKLQKE